MKLYGGLQYLSDQNKPNYGLFMNSAPDRWGRMLIRRREAVEAKKEARPERTLRETDYLLGVFDAYRMGGLRFKTLGNERFLSDNKDYAIPPWSTIRNLEEISLHIEQEDSTHDPEYQRWLSMLLGPGSSLGGARPKAGVLDLDGHLWIAKFPSRYDTSDVGGWEMVAHELAKRAGINVAEGVARRFSNRHHTYLTRRFDRTEDNERLHYASAMTLLGYNDGMDHDDDISYLELAGFIMRNSACAERDLEELWRRIVFSICISNTDDHLRNHGFLLDHDGWRLSPVFDVNPNENGLGLKLNITETDNSLDHELAMAVHPFFRLSIKKAKATLVQVKDAVKGWRSIAESCSISKSEQDTKSRAFRY